MGGGFYDRTLAKIQHFSTPDKSRSPDTTSRPWFIGVAHACQAVTQLTQASWDIPMDYIITDKNILSAKAK
jgi:5-formyltetrahydrofolate cyclo-ligase